MSMFSKPLVHREKRQQPGLDHVHSSLVSEAWLTIPEPGGWHNSGAKAPQESPVQIFYSRLRMLFRALSIWVLKNPQRISHSHWETSATA